MLDLGEIGVGIAVVDQRVEVVGHLPDAFLAALQRAVFRFLRDYKIVGLVGVVLAIELGDLGIGVGFVVAEFFFGFALAVAGGYEIVPVVDFMERAIGGYRLHNSSIMNR